MQLHSHPAASAFLSLLLLFVSLTSASVLTIRIPASQILPNLNALPASTHATLTTLPFTSSSSSSSSSSPSPRRLRARLTRSSTLVFPDLSQPPHSHSASESDPSTTTTSYLLDIHSRDYVFAPYRVDVDARGAVVGVWETYRGHAWAEKGAEKYLGGGGDTDGSGNGNGQGNVVLVEPRVVGRRGFYEARKTFSPLSLFKNPMILLGIFGLAVTFGMPYLMENMDPEMREEFERQRGGGAGGGASRGAAASSGGAGGGGGARDAGFDLAGWMAGTSPGPMDAASRAATSGRENAQAGPARRR